MAVYDLERMVMFVANARGDGEEGPTMAYDRWAGLGSWWVGCELHPVCACTHTHTHTHTQAHTPNHKLFSLSSLRAFLQLDMKAIFAEKPPEELE